MSRRTADSIDEVLWMEKAACRGMDPNKFFPTIAYRKAEIIEVCKTCPVNRACYIYAVKRPYLRGIWGGSTYQERELVRRNLL